MDLVKVQSIKAFGRKTQLGNEVVSFDQNGVAEISKELWEKYKDLPTLFEFGKAPKPEDTIKIKEDDSAEVAALKKEVGRYKGIVDSKEKKIKAAIEGEKQWRTKVDELLGEIELLKKDSSNVFKAEKVEDSELRKQLESMTEKTLPKFLKDNLGLSKRQIDSLKSKEEMVNFALDAVNKA